MSTSSNPLLQPYQTPFGTVPFDLINDEHYLPALKEAITVGKAEVHAIAENAAEPTFENTIVALDNAGSLADKVSHVLFNQYSAATNPELQKIVQEASPLLAEYGNDIALNAKLFARIKHVYNQRNGLGLDAESLTLLEKTYKGFARNGANLNEADKEKLRAIDAQLSELGPQFSEHVLNETNDFLLEVTDEKDLAGLPEFVREAAKETAKEKEKSGWVFTLQAPSIQPFLTYSENRELRHQLFMAFNSRAFKDNANDNRSVIKQIVQLRYERAKLLGYQTHADFVLEERMAGSSEKVNNFLNEMLDYAKPVAEQQMQELTEYAKQQGFVEDQLQRWDYGFYSEKLKKEKYSIDDEQLKPYFKLENVIDGAFQVANQLFGLTFKENKTIPVYHPEVTTYEVADQEGQLVAIFYADFFPRAAKRAGAWMTSYRNQKVQNGENIRPHVAIVCNFTKPTATKPSLLTFNEVTTLFHEFGHSLHGILSDVKYQGVSGTSVYWDFVELPSQVMENWCYEKEALDLFARHYETNEPIPQTLIEKIKASSSFMEGVTTLRQISFGLLDMAWHSQEPTDEAVDSFEQKIIAATNLYPPVAGTNSSCSFSHIFAGGYSAGYYSYKWAEVLDADAFEYFQEKGIFNKEVADSFKNNVLSKGGSENPMVLYKRFRGQEPSPKALLKRAGLLKAEVSR
ncbi:MAG: M3 family metallopeptidase [Bacteroidota bacterium]